MLNAQCSMLDAQCSMLDAFRQVGGILAAVLIFSFLVPPEELRILMKQTGK
jgi:hypothetical protein